MGRRFHNERYGQKLSRRMRAKLWHGSFPAWLKRHWNKIERRRQDRLVATCEDPDALSMPPEKKITDVWDWF